MKYYHGSPTPNLTLLIPRLDLRTGIKGVFVSNEVFGPCMYSLLPDRSNTAISYTTVGGRFISGSVMTYYPLNPLGYLYEVVVSDEAILNVPNEFYFTTPVACKFLKEVSEKEVKDLGWVVEVVNIGD